jgi:4-amino-4-deoxy-L-arabinose transferase-like glycosyltransferase
MATALRKINLPLVLGFLVLFALGWSAVLAWTSLTLPADSIEQWIWMRSLEWGYYKHPPLPTWMLRLASRVFGDSPATVAGLGAATTAAALALFWCLLRRVRGTAYATVALLAAACITYYNGRLNYYNHNVVLLLASTACACALERALATRRLAWWLVLGLALGLGALAKYQIAVTAACVAAVVAYRGTWRDPLQRRGLLAALLAAVLVVAPHAAWLLAQRDGPIDYAMRSSLGVSLDIASRIAATLHWLADQVLNRALPAWLLLGASLLAIERPGPAPRAAERAAADDARVLLRVWGLLPLGFMALMGLATGAELQLQWGTGFLLFLVPAVMEAMPVDWQRLPLRSLAQSFLVLQAVLVTLAVARSPQAPRAWRDSHWRQFDAGPLAEAMAPLAREVLGGAVPVVIGPYAMAGAVALRLPERPRVLIDGRYDRSPWLTAAWVARHGGIEIAPTRQLPEGTPFGTRAPGWSWRIVPPTPETPPAPVPLGPVDP